MPPTPLGLRVRAALGQHHLIGAFRYAEIQRLKEAPDGPTVRATLDASRGLRLCGYRGWDYSYRDEDDWVWRWLRDRFGWNPFRVVDRERRPDPLAASDPDDEALRAAFADLGRQVQEWEARARWTAGSE